MGGARAQEAPPGRSSARAAAAAGSRLATPGILFDMIGPETDEPGAIAVEHAAPGGGRGGAQAWAAALALGCGVGAFFAALAGLHEHALQRGIRLPSHTWMHAWSLWLPVGVLGFAAARLLAGVQRLRDGLRWVGLGAVLAVAVVQVATVALLPWLAAPAAAVLGIATGLSVGHVRRLRPWLAIPAIAASAVAAACLRDAHLSLVVALAGGLLGVLLSAGERAYAQPARLRWWQLASFVALAWSLPAVAGEPLGQPALLAGFVAACVAARLLRRDGVLLGAAVAALSLPWLGERAPSPQAGGEQVLERARAAEVVYRRADQELQLRRHDEVLVAVGPDRLEQPLAIALAHALLRVGDRALVFGSGGARIARSLRADGRFQVEVARGFCDVVDVEHAVVADGGVSPAAGDAIDADEARPLARRRGGSQQLVVVGEVPTAATAHRATRAFQRQLRRIVADGYVVQVIALDRAPPPVLAALFDAADAAYAWNGLYRLSATSAALLSGPRLPDWSAQLAAAPAATRWALHRAHLGGAEDLAEALCGTLRRPSASAAATAAPDQVAAVLRQWLAAPAVTLGPLGQSVLRRWARRRAELQRLLDQARTKADDPDGRAEVQAMALRFLPMGAPAAWLQAALGLPGADGVALRDPNHASLCAHAIDPTFFVDAPPVFASLQRPTERRGALEDFGALPTGERLAELCVGERPLAVALRARFGSRCAEALCAQLAIGPLSPDQSQALRQLADPFVLREAAGALLPAGRWRELLGLWRGDLPMPTALLDVAALGVEERRDLASALRGRSDPTCHALLAAFLVDDDDDLRRVAASLLRDVVGDVIRYDPDWPRSRRVDAADRLRGLHNRKP